MRARELRAVGSGGRSSSTRTCGCTAGARAPRRPPAANACVPGALLVRANAAEAPLMTGEEDPERAAAALLSRPARALVVITLGADGAILRGELRADVAGRAPAQRAQHDRRRRRADRHAAGAAGRHAASTRRPSAASLPEAVPQAARACERWGALE